MANPDPNSNLVRGEARRVLCFDERHALVRVRLRARVRVRVRLKP